MAKEAPTRRLMESYSANRGGCATSRHDAGAGLPVRLACVCASRPSPDRMLMPAVTTRGQPPVAAIRTHAHANTHTDTHKVHVPYCSGRHRCASTRRVHAEARKQGGCTPTRGQWQPRGPCVQRPAGWWWQRVFIIHHGSHPWSNMGHGPRRYHVGTSTQTAQHSNSAVPIQVYCRHATTPSLVSSSSSSSLMASQHARPLPVGHTLTST